MLMEIPHPMHIQYGPVNSLIPTDDDDDGEKMPMAKFQTKVF